MEFQAKKYEQWNEVKKIIERKNNVKLFKEREVWWVHTGWNIGTEINGKHSKFLRPVLIFRKFSRYSFTGFPLTTKIKIGSWYYSINIKNKDNRVLLHQLKMFDSKRLYTKIEELSSDKFKRIEQTYCKLYHFN